MNIYFDNAASATPQEETVEIFRKTASENFSNPAALHKGGIEAEKIITAARETILSKLVKTPTKGNLLFTSGATESNNLAILNSVKPRGKTKIVTTMFEHPSVSVTADRLCETDGFEIVRIPPFGDIAQAVDDNTALVSMTAVCGETGYINPINEFYTEIKANYPDCIVHVDGVQGFLKQDKHYRQLEITADLISLSAHKIGGLPGVGGLYVKEGIRLKPMLYGGGQQNGIRPGTEPTALIAAFAAAVNADLFDCTPLYNRLTQGLNRLNLKLNSSDSNSSIPHTVNFSCEVKSEVMLHFLAERGVYVSSGSACARGKKSKILPAFGATDSDTDTAIRVSFWRRNTVTEVDEFLNILEEGLKRWKK